MLAFLYDIKTHGDFKKYFDTTQKRNNSIGVSHIELARHLVKEGVIDNIDEYVIKEFLTD